MAADAYFRQRWRTRHVPVFRVLFSPVLFSLEYKRVLIGMIERVGDRSKACINRHDRTCW